MRAVKLAPPHRLVDRALAPALLFFALRVAHLALAPVVHHVLAGVRLDGARRLLGLHVCFERLAPLVQARGLLDGGCGGLASGLVRVIGEGGVDAWAGFVSWRTCCWLLLLGLHERTALGEGHVFVFEGR